MEQSYCGANRRGAAGRSLVQLFLKTLARDASGEKICATTKNWPIGKIEYIATVDLINSYNIDRISILLSHLALCKIISLNISEIAM